MRLILTLVLLLLPLHAIAAQKFGVLDYVSLDQTTRDWMDSKFELKINHYNPPSTGLRMEYYDIYGPQTIAELNLLMDYVASKGLARESALLHAKKNWTITGQLDAAGWKFMNKFDNFEGANGVLRTADDVAYTDLTATAYNGAVTWQNTMYIGYEEPFDQINLVFSTPGAGITRAWEYWNGSTWAELTVSGTGAGLTATGQVYFTPPSGWARKVVNSSRSKYFVRCRITAASTSPITSSIKGDDWLRGTATALRGWDATSGTIVNSGELTYNPTPPAGASAKFPYQARIPYWASNRFVGNPSYLATVDGAPNARVFARFLAYRTGQLLTGGYSGIMGDDGGASGNLHGLNITTAGDTDFQDFTAETWTAENAAKYQELVTVFKAANPDKYMGLNATTKTLVSLGDWNLIEGYYNTFNTGGAGRQIATADSANSCYDDYLSGSKFGFMVYSDPGVASQASAPNTLATWDRANRGPILALSKHLIASNANTYFGYHASTIYNEVDEVELTNGTIVHMATQAVPALASVKRWASYFPAMSVDFGIPDAAGWNGGARHFQWASADGTGIAGTVHTGIGGTQDVWRRDYTNAIVLHRPAMYSTTDSEFSTPSTAMDLGGSYYPLYADGTIGAAVTSISLRTGEGAILMKVGGAPTPTPKHFTGKLNGNLH